MYTDVPPQWAARAVAQHAQSVPRSDIIVSWFAVSDNREAYRESLLDELHDVSCAVICLRSHGFNNANALMADLMDLLTLEKELVEPAWQNSNTPHQMVVLAKEPLSVPMLASPSLAPPWIPSIGGRMAQVHVKDLTLNSLAPLGSMESGIPAVSLPLYELEDALISRLTVSVSPQVDQLLLALRRYDDGLAVTTARFRTTHSNVTNARQFRPSRRDQDSLVSELWRLHERTSVEVTQKTAKALTDALLLPPVSDPDWTISFFGLLKRGGWRSTDWRMEFAADLLSVIAVSCQLLSAAGHPDRSPSFGVQLLRSGSSEIVRSLKSTRQVLLSSLPDASHR